MSDLTARQESAQAAWDKANTALRNASHGERTRARKALEKAALEVLRADNAAAWERKQATVAA